MLFSVIVPIYGVEEYIRKCVDSILAQSFKDFELILVDDGSKDNCPAICDKYAEADARVRVIHKENGGLVSARNAGIAAARAEYVCYVDGDDWVTENWLETVRRNIERSPVRPDLVVFGFTRVFSDRTEVDVITIDDGFYDKARLEKEVYPILISDRRYYLGKECVYPSAWNKAYRRELLERHHCTSTKITRGEDTSFTLECFLYAESAAVCSDPVYYYNKTNNSSNLTRYDSHRALAYYRLFEYLNERVVGLYDCVDAQMNDLYANYIATILTHELSHHPAIPEAARNIRRQFKEADVMSFIKAKGLPFSARVLVRLLKMKLYFPALLGCRIWYKKKKAD